MDEQLLLRNRANAEPTMKAAAQRVGAVLLSAEAEAFETSPLCGLSSNPCLDEVEFKGSFSRVRDARGEARLAIWVPVELRRYARLARRSDQLFLLMPRVSRRVIDQKTCCECDGMLRAAGRVQAGFLVDEVPGVQLVTVDVPVTVDRYQWKCKATAR
ncbi:MAG TPA: hypothetical protein VGC79_37640 [Polyangiaceae bacterium]